jgi:hypothetical protein
MSASLQLADPKEQEIQSEGELLVAEANALTVTDSASYTALAEFLKSIKRSLKSIEDYFSGLITPQRTALQALYDRKNSHIKPREEAERIAKKKIASYEEQLERERRVEEARLQEEARVREEERRMQEALDMESDGDRKGAEQLLSEPIEPMPVRVAPSTPKVAGISFREEWKFELGSIVEVAKHVAAHPEDACLLALNTTAVGQMVRARKSAFKVPGIRAYMEKNVAAGGRR